MSTRPAAVWAERLLRLVGAVGAGPEGADRGAADAAGDWAESGAMALTGRPDGPPLVAPGMAASAARGAALVIAHLTEMSPGLEAVDVDGGLLLGERAAIAGLTRQGPISPGGTCRLVPAAEGILAVNLPRPEDEASVHAWLETAPGADVWETVTSACGARSAGELAERGQLLGIPVAAVPPAGSITTAAPFRIRPGPATGIENTGPGRVVDLSSMWAGPLCAHLLGLAGFEVVKVEATRRPDGARAGPPAFFDLMHGGHKSVALDFGSESDLAALGRLLDSADIVIESSRPRALDQLGLGPDMVLARSPATVWVSITGYGRSGAWRDRVAFGDDAAAAAGLIAWDGDTPCVCGDAIADPLAGLHAAVSALSLWVAARGGLVDVSMRDAVASALVGVEDPSPLPTLPDGVSVQEPSARTPQLRASALGADTDGVLAGLRT
ncbi:MAG: CoA transferase [Acidimicrobiia bacterium]|nr:CoA transferase [Acidimicrobiia bacterium]